MIIFPVIGGVRTGNTILAAMLHKCGVRMFPPGRAINDNVGDDMNPGGHFADADFHALITRFLLGLQQPTEGWVPDHDTIADIAALVEARRDSGKWGFKGLHSWVGAKVLSALTHDVRIIRTSRPLAQSQASYASHVGELFQAGADAFVESTKVAADAFYDSFSGPKLTVPFDALFDDTAGSVAAIAAFAGVAPAQEAIDFVNPDWRRFS